jgi:hypothetical protein
MHSEGINERPFTIDDSIDIEMCFCTVKASHSLWDESDTVSSKYSFEFSGGEEPSRCVITG